MNVNKNMVHGTLYKYRAQIQRQFSARTTHLYLLKLTVYHQTEI